MTRKFTFLLMALLALAGFKSWGQETITVDFESGIPSGWTQIDANNDGYIWSVTTDAKHEGQYGLQSESYRGAITPDNYFVSPQLTLGSGANIKFWADTFWGYAEHFGVFISTTGGTNAADFTDKVFEYTFNGSGFKEFSVDLGAYQGQQVYIAFRHYEVYDKYRVYIDDITINLGLLGTQYNIAYDNANIEHGSITGPATAYAGQTITVTATPDAGYALEHITVNGTNYLGNTFTMPEDNATVTATFVSGLTVNDGTDVYDKAPFYGEYANSGLTKSQFVIPASYLESIQGSEITQLKFYLDPTSSYNPSYTSHTWDVYINEMNDPSGTWWDFYNFETMTNVYSGSVSIVDNQLTITLDEPFQYNSNSLMIGFNQTNTGFSGVTKWIGSNNTTGSAGTYRCRAGWSGNKETMSFLPKTTFYTQVVTCPKPTGLTASNITGTGATISWTGNGAESYDLAYGVASTFDLSNPSTYTLEDGLTTTSVQLTGLTAETEYKCAVKAHCSGEEESAWSAVCSFTPTAKTTLTVNDGTNTNSYVPIYGFYADATCKSQFIIPASALGDMLGGTVSDMTFYLNSSSSISFTGTWDVYVKEVDNTTLSGFVSWSELGSAVYHGNMTITNGQLTVNFTAPITYNGNNLLIGFNETVSGNCPSTSWLGVSQSSNTAWYSTYNNAGSAQSFLPKTTFTYIPGGERYNVICDDAITGGSISANPAKAAAGTTVTLTPNPAYGYEFGAWVEDYEDVTIVDNQFTMPEHNVTISATFNELTKYAINSAVVAGGTVHAEYDNVTITEAPEGTVITLVAEAAEDYIFEYFTVDGVQIEGNTYTMGTSAIGIGASFRPVQSYTIHYYVNGYNNKNETKKETQTINITSPYDGLVPAGTEFFGWSFDDIATYQTVEPSIIGEGVHPTQECNVYAVFKCIETVISDNWEPIWMAPQDGEEVIFANYIWSEEQQATLCYVMCDRSYQYDSKFSSGVCTVDASGKIISAPGNVTIFNVEILDNGNLKFHFNDISQGESTLADLDGSNLVPQSLWGGVDTWVNDWGTVYNTRSSSDYISCYGNPNLIFCINTYNQSRMYRRASEENSYYMTEVLGYGGADEHIASNTSATNVVIAKNAKLTIDDDATLNVEGICLSASHDAAQLVIADGGQLVHHNAGTMATFEKEIKAYQEATGNDGYYLIANPTNNATVTNLTSTSNNYDLYTFNPAGDGYGNEWINMHSSPAVANGTGYLYANSGDVTLQFAGELTPAAETEITLVKADAGTDIDFPGFNLIGNPYACNAYVSGYNFYRMTGGELQTAGTSATVAPCEGFFVEARTNGDKVTLSTTAPEAPANMMSLSVSQNRGNVIDRAIVRFDGANDLHKFMLNPQRTNIRLAKNGEEFAAISSETEGEIPVSFKAEKNGSYTITVNTENVEANYLHLIDNLTGMDTDLLNTPSYTFNASTSDYAYRFKLVFSMTDVEENESNANSFAYISNGNLVINNIEGEATMQIVDMLGRVVSTEIVSGSYNKALNLKAGLYIINLNGMTQKIVVK